MARPVCLVICVLLLEISGQAAAQAGKGAEVCSDSLMGLLDPLSTHFNRRAAGSESVSLNCELVTLDSTNDFVPYQAFPIRAEGTGTAALTAQIESVDPPGLSTTLSLYCDPFDPLNPGANLLAFDENGGADGRSGLLDSDGINLQAGTRYWLVVSGDTTATEGAFSVCLGGGFVRDAACERPIPGALGDTSLHFNRAVGNGVDDACNLATIDTVQDNMPYVANPFRANAREYFEASLIAEDTTVADPVFALYCSGFDPAAPLANMVAYDDNDGDGNLPAFNINDKIPLVPGNVYWLVVTTFSGNDADGGVFSLCLPGDVLPWYPEPGCGDAEFGQAPALPYETWNGFGSSDTSNAMRLDNYYGLFGGIWGVKWWGFAGIVNDNALCSDIPEQFEITLYRDSSGEPGSVELSEGVTPTIRVREYEYYADAQRQPKLIEFTAWLPNPILLTGGWIRIRAIDSSNCTFKWVTSNNGDGKSGVTDSNGLNYAETGQDYAFCLITDAPYHATDTNEDLDISLTEVLRVIQLYNASIFHCDVAGEDGFNPGPGDETCTRHSADYAPDDWRISISELLRVIQFYNLGGYHLCPGEEDDYCAGPED
ncbi:MAG: hypothetical protein GC168_15565 [Candidatus Hydrogenedens sp.]|nr:hypothetical protein [Candidatus Hydrogenedens sp.]